jgi:NitT/TauT family transport system permease protein
LLAFAITWELFARLSDSLLIPSFSATLAALLQLLGQAETWQAMWISNQALIGGFLLSVLVGVPLGFVLGNVRRASRIADLYLNTLLVIPVAAVLPLFILAVGLGLTARILVVFVFSFVVITVNTQAGLRQVDPTLVEMASSFGARKGQLWRRILLPSAGPAIMAGLRLGLGRAIAGMVIVELLLVAVGYGRLILRYQSDFESAQVFAVVLLVLAEAMLLMALARRLELRTTRWQGEARIE